MIFDIEIDTMESRMNVVKEEHGKWRNLWKEDEEKFTVYLRDLDGTMLRSSVMKKSMDSQSTYNFRQLFCTMGLRIVEPVAEKVYLNSKTDSEVLKDGNREQEIDIVRSDNEDEQR